MNVSGPDTGYVVVAAILVVGVTGGALAATTGALPAPTASNTSLQPGDFASNGSVNIVVNGTNTTETGEVSVGDSLPVINAATATDLSDGDGIVGNGDQVKIAATVRDFEGEVRYVEADASAFGAGVVELTDETGNETYTTTITIAASRAATDGAHPIRILANDTADNTVSSITNELELATASDTTPTPTNVEPISRSAPGFGVLVVVVALLLGTLLATWRR